jgi:T-complex protein 1 subunit beta
MQQPR